MKKKKVAIIFPKFCLNDSSHFPYWYRIFEEAGKKLPLKVFFETGAGKIKLDNCETYLQYFQKKPFNLFERAIYFIYLRCRGYKKFYIHYSLFSFFIAKFVTKALGGETYLWDCEYYQQIPENKILVQALRWTDTIVTGHKKIANQYKKILDNMNKRTEVIESWVIDDIKSFKKIHSLKKAIRKTKPNILFVHDLSLRKGSRELPEIIDTILNSSGRMVSFTIVGGGPDYEFLKNWLAAKHFRSEVRLTGPLSLKQTWEEFKKADIYILPSRAEGFPRVILEAMQYGLPYIATDVGCVKEITPLEIKDFVIAVGDTSLFCKKITEMLDFSYDKMKKSKMAMKKAVKQYYLSRTVKCFIDIFN